MKTLKIKSKDFLNWYFFSCSDQEQRETALNLGYNIIIGLLDGGINIAPEDILNVCNTNIIPLKIVEGYENEDNGTEIKDIFTDYEVILI